MRQARVFLIVAMVVLLPHVGAAQSVAPAPVKLGLALSGGGFRAAAFHLGVLRELDRQGLLDEVDVISCVSGGCITAGALLLHWDKPDRLDVVKAYLTNGKDTARRCFWDGLLRPFATRVDCLVKSLDRDLFNGATLADLREGPRVYFNATNVAKGTRFFFTSGIAPDVPSGYENVILRDQTIEPCPADDFPIAKAVAASAAFPPVFNPLRLERRCLKEQDVPYVSLTDGGVYDNLGFGPFLFDINVWPTELDFIILSDGGTPFAFQEEAATTGPGVVTRIPSIQMANIRGLGLQLLIDHYCDDRGPRPIFFSIDSASGEAQLGDAEAASAIDTDLKSLDTEEIDVLTRHGATLVRDRLQIYAPDILGASVPRESVCQTTFALGDVGGIFPWDR